MNCRDAQVILHAYTDGELDLTGSLELERHLASCPDCAQFHQNLRTLHIAVKSPELYSRAPAGLAGKIEGALRQETRPQERKVPARWLSVGLTTTTALAAILLMILLPMTRRHSAELAYLKPDLSREIVACHVRSLMANHITDVVSTDRHTVKPWFNGKLDYAPPVIDLREKGFPLIGGRLDYLDERPVTVMVYTRQKHTINLFVWPVKRSANGAQAEDLKQSTLQGYHLTHWIQADLQFWAISDLNAIELESFAQLLREGSVNTP